jgi:hypothetical protein
MRDDSFTDGTITNEVDVETLITLSNTQYDDEITSSMWSCGHPMHHPLDENLLVNWAGAHHKLHATCVPNSACRDQRPWS